MFRSELVPNTETSPIDAPRRVTILYVHKTLIVSSRRRFAFVNAAVLIRTLFLYVAIKKKNRTPPSEANRRFGGRVYSNEKNVSSLF